MKLDWNKYKEVARKAIAEGNVLLKNENQVLPLKKGSNVALFGRIQTHYYKSGTGSGGMVNVDKVTGILEALLESNEVSVNQELLAVYREWEEDHPFDQGIGWGAEPWSQKEMELSDEVVEKAAKESETALVIIGRTAGEDQDNFNDEASYCLTKLEKEMLEKVRKHFRKMVVILNVGNIIDMSFEEECHPDAVLYAWQGGMEGGYGTADILLGKVNPSGRLTDTIAYEIKDYPSDENFGDPDKNYYKEDIYVGYRYFETVKPEAVKYPFGYGLSYTEFVHETKNAKEENGIITFDVDVTNAGAVAGKEVVQVYVTAPQGLLGKPAVTLCGFAKTAELAPGATETISFSIDENTFASFDDTGITGQDAAFVLEAGTYVIKEGKNVRELTDVIEYERKELKVVEKLSHALAPIESFERMKPVKSETSATGYVMEKEQIAASENLDMAHRNENLPAEIAQTGDKGYKLADVKSGKVSMDEFIAQFADTDLECIIRGEGMGSSKVTPGTASAFGAVAKSLKEFGLPCACCSDGPSGMRMDSGKQAFSLPNGTLLACTFNEAISTELFYLLGIEMGYQKVDNLLGPGMNIHRHPLNGRNFEYFSEDPYLTGKIGAAQIKGLKNAGVTGTMKHFCGNNQEARRHYVDSVISERALREIYLKGFEMAVKEAGADSVMTTYGQVNGGYTAGKYDLNTRILRDEWGFKGIVMTDWWARISETNGPASMNNFAQMVRAQNDLYMVCADGAVNGNDENTITSLQDGTLTRGELQRCAKNICEFLLTTRAMERLCGTLEEHEIINRPKTAEDEAIENMVYYDMTEEGLTLPLDVKDYKRGEVVMFGLNVERPGGYEVSITGKSDAGELAQIPITLFIQNLPLVGFTFNGTNGEWVTLTKRLLLNNKNEMLKLYFGQSGLTMKEVKFTFKKDKKDIVVGREFIDELN